MHNVLMRNTYLEAKNDGPDETKCKTVAAINNVMCSHVFQMDSLFMEESQGLVYVLQTVDTHLAFGRSRLAIKDNMSELKPVNQTSFLWCQGQIF